MPPDATQIDPALLKQVQSAWATRCNEDSKIAQALAAPSPPPEILALATKLLGMASADAQDDADDDADEPHGGPALAPEQRSAKRDAKAFSGAFRGMAETRKARRLDVGGGFWPSDLASEEAGKRAIKLAYGKR